MVARQKTRRGPKSKKVADLPAKDRVEGASTLKEGDLVWLKMRGYPIWPGKIVPQTHPKRPCEPAHPSYILIRFFGSRDFKWVPPAVFGTKLFSLIDNWEAHYVAKPGRQAYAEAMKYAHIARQKRLDKVDAVHDEGLSDLDDVTDDEDESQESDAPKEKPIRAKRVRETPAAPIKRKPRKSSASSKSDEPAAASEDESSSEETDAESTSDEKDESSEGKAEKKEEEEEDTGPTRIVTFSSRGRKRNQRDFREIFALGKKPRRPKGASADGKEGEDDADKEAEGEKDKGKADEKETPKKGAEKVKEKMTEAETPKSPKKRGRKKASEKAKEPEPEPEPKKEGAKRGRKPRKSVESEEETKQEAVKRSTRDSKSKASDKNETPEKSTTKSAEKGKDETKEKPSKSKAVTFTDTAVKEASSSKKTEKQDASKSPAKEAKDTKVAPNPVESNAKDSKLDVKASDDSKTKEKSKSKEKDAKKPKTEESSKEKEKEKAPKKPETPRKDEAKGDTKPKDSDKEKPKELIEEPKLPEKSADTSKGKEKEKEKEKKGGDSEEKEKTKKRKLEGKELKSLETSKPSSSSGDNLPPGLAATPTASRVLEKDKDKSKEKKKDKKKSSGDKGDSDDENFDFPSRIKTSADEIQGLLRDIDSSKPKPEDLPKLKTTLKAMLTLQYDSKLLMETKLGLSIKDFRNHQDEEVRQMYKKLKKTLISDYKKTSETSKEAPEQVDSEDKKHDEPPRQEATLAEVQKFMTDIDANKAKPEDLPKLKTTLKTMLTLQYDSKLLIETKLGLSIKDFRNHQDEEVRQMYKKLKKMLIFDYKKTFEAPVATHDTPTKSVEKGSPAAEGKTEIEGKTDSIPTSNTEQQPNAAVEKTNANPDQTESSTTIDEKTADDAPVTNTEQEPNAAAEKTNANPEQTESSTTTNEKAAEPARTEASKSD